MWISIPGGSEVRLTRSLPLDKWEAALLEPYGKRHHRCSGSPIKVKQQIQMPGLTFIRRRQRFAGEIGLHPQKLARVLRRALVLMQDTASVADETLGEIAALVVSGNLRFD
jgi:hypothetical protein